MEPKLKTLTELKIFFSGRWFISLLKMSERGFKWFRLPRLSKIFRQSSYSTLTVRVEVNFSPLAWRRTKHICADWLRRAVFFYLFKVFPFSNLYISACQFCGHGQTAINITDEGKFHVDFKNASGSVGEGEPPMDRKPDVTIRLSSDIFVKIFNRKLHEQHFSFVTIFRFFERTYAYRRIT